MNPKFLIIVCTLALLFTSASVHSQNLEFSWAKSTGGTSLDMVFDVGIDPYGNTYTIGLFRESMNLDVASGTTQLTSAGERDVFIQKLDASGNRIWAYSMGGPEFDAGYTIAYDAAGYLYIGGGFADQTDLDPGPGVSNLTSAGRSDAFLAKLDTSGTFMWAKSFGGIVSDYLYEITTDAAGNVYALGEFSDSIDLDPGMGVVPALGSLGRNLFLVKLDAAGDFVWGRSWGDTNSQISFNYDIAIDDQQQVYLTGGIIGSMDLDPGPGSQVVDPQGIPTGFLVKLDAAGDFEWGQTMNSTLGADGISLALDASGNVYTGGTYFDSLELTTSTDTLLLETSDYERDVFVAQWSASGTPQWVRSIGGNNRDELAGLQVDGSGYIYLTGWFRDDIDLDPGTGSTNAQAAGNADLYIVQLDDSGSFASGFTLGSLESEQPVACELDGQGSIYVTGNYGGTVDFNPGPAAAPLASMGVTDVFVAKYTTGVISGISPVEPSQELRIYPNPVTDQVFIDARQLGDPSGVLTIRTITGQVVLQERYASSSLFSAPIPGPGGLYILELQTDSGNTYVQKLIKR